MTRLIAMLSAVIAALMATPGSAQTREIIEGAFAGPASDKAYIMYHVPKGKNGLPAQPIFMLMSIDDRAPLDEPLLAARNGKSFAKSDAVRVYLLEVPPGEYLVYGLSLSAAAPTLATCFCLGTVSFVAKPGIITDVGAVLVGNARLPSGFPELATETGLGPSIDTGFYNPAGALRPEPSGRYLAGRLDQAKTERATFRAAGRFFDPRTAFVNRLAPLSGVLSYDGGKPIDATTGAAVPDHFAEEVR